MDNVLKVVASFLVAIVPLSAISQNDEPLWSTFDPASNRLTFPCLIVTGAGLLDGNWSLSLAANLEQGELVLADAYPITSIPVDCRLDSLVVTSEGEVISDAVISSNNTTFIDDLDRNTVFEVRLSLDSSRNDNFYFLIDSAQQRNFQSNVAPEIDTEGNLGDFPKDLSFDFELPANNVPDQITLYLPEVEPDPEGDFVKLIIEDELGNLLLDNARSGQAISIPVTQSQGQTIFTLVVFPVDEFGAKGEGIQSTVTINVAAISSSQANWDNFNWNEANWN